MKIWFDFSLALLILAVSWPIILLALVLVRLTSRGPLLYTQRRLGHNGRPFLIYKIRTMIPNSEPNGPRWCLSGDPRVTPVGRFLRWSHFDELPQLINFLRGEMSLIGPRPERPEIVAQLEHVLPGYGQRLSVRPGLTGLAQVLSPPDTDISTVRTKLSYDRHYVHHLGPWLDIKIGLATAFHLIRLPADLIRQVFRFPCGSSGDTMPIYPWARGSVPGRPVRPDAVSVLPFGWCRLVNGSLSDDQPSDSQLSSDDG
jgi:lipopolysaccharide/colanic/teichoic acid biosynthesis glycosyltransferase